jgi:hypothetical protein
MIAVSDQRTEVAMRARLGFWRGILSAASFLMFAISGVEAKTIYVAVSNPDMSFLSGGVAKYQDTSKMRV